METTRPGLLVEREGKIEPDDFSGEQALFFMVRNKGLVVLSGCAHRGIVNTVKQARRAAGIDKVHAVMGGFHLINADPEIIESCRGHRGDRADYVAPAHCTGFEAMHGVQQSDARRIRAQYRRKPVHLFSVKRRRSHR